MKPLPFLLLATCCLLYSCSNNPVVVPPEDNDPTCDLIAEVYYLQTLEDGSIEHVTK